MKPFLPHIMATCLVFGLGCANCPLSCPMCACCAKSCGPKPATTEAAIPATEAVTKSGPAKSATPPSNSSAAKVIEIPATSAIKSLTQDETDIPVPAAPNVHHTLRNHIPPAAIPATSTSVAKTAEPEPMPALTAKRTELFDPELKPVGHFEPAETPAPNPVARNRSERDEQWNASELTGVTTLVPAAPSELKPVPEATKTMPALPANVRHAHAEDYSWVQGELVRIHSRGGFWQVRFASYDQADSYGGKFVVVGDLPSDVKEGDLVRVQGRILGYDPRLNGTEYRVNKMEKVPAIVVKNAR